MAYTVPGVDDDEQQQGDTTPATPKLGTSSTPTPGLGTSPAPTNAAAPQQSPQQASGSGTGWTNLQDWLDAGQGRDKSISQTGQQTLQSEQQEYSKAATPVKNQVYDFKAQTGDVNSLLNNGDEAGLKNLMTQDYKGPMGFNFNATGREGVHKAAALGSTETAGKALAGKQPYDPGVQTLDQILFGADRASRDASEKVDKDTNAFIDKTRADEKAIGEQAQKNVKAAADAREKTTADMRAAADRIRGDVQKRVDALNAGVRNDYANGIVRDPTTGHVVNLGKDKTRGEWEAGIDATLGNQATEQDRAGLDMLSRLLGDESLAIASDPNKFYGGRWTTQAVAPELTVTPMEQVKLSAPGEATGGGTSHTSNAAISAGNPVVNLNPAQQITYQQQRDAGMTHEQAMLYASLK